MILFRPKKTTGIFISAIIVILAISFFSCQKELTGQFSDIITTPPDLSYNVSSSVSGFVTDENNATVNGAVVTVGSSNTVTDKYGFFEVKNVPVVKEAAVVTIDRPGYFKAIKTWLATEGKSAFFRIKLIPKTNAGHIDATAGGKVTLPNGLTIMLPANAVVNAATNAAYTGQVNVAAHWIDPLASDLNRTMPGDLRGLDSAGTLKLLTTYGMAAVELTGSGDELLQIASGKKATLSIPLPFAIVANAPSTIPLWYFDEALGLWKQQGNAVKSGNSYIGEVSHFSYWNCDYPSSYMHFTCTIVDAKGKPVQNALVKISFVNKSQNTGCGYTDSAGYTGGAVPANSQLLLQVFGEDNCSTALYSQNFTTTNTNIVLGNIVISAATASIATVTGKVVNCSNAAVKNGFVMMVKDGINYRYRVDTTGAFSFTTTLCSANTNAAFIAEDISALQSGISTTVALVAGANVIGSLTACGTNTLQFINYAINGTSYTLAAPVDSLYDQSIGQYIYINGYSVNSGNSSSASLIFAQAGIAVNSIQNLISFHPSQIADSSSISTPINVYITEYGNVGQFLSGNFIGTFTGAPPANKTYNITCSFRIRR